ncbi:hypothetical protein [Variovorax sp. YR216]|uniref:hypothetical protein n=1 Tax=Variovorax sp. YR216 TaxID=1882828 RepID=UPI0008974791|nr:hypothetical protein [Variovorax sp. YR216]SEB24407.1 hypothetical protein SAMN05444680_12055 [Variovorax sp. YR216]
MTGTDRSGRKGQTDKREVEIETVPHSLDSQPSAQPDAKTFLGAVVNFFRRNADVESLGSTVAAVPAHQGSATPHCEQMVVKSALYKHWNAIKADGITASQFIAFLQPLADLDGITVSYSYSDGDGVEHIYNRRRGEVGRADPLSRAIQEKKLSKEKALSFALNEEGRVWIESNFVDLNDLR